MGYNTTVVVMNDALGEIAEDSEFGARLARAIREVHRGKPVDVPAHGKHGIHCNAATVIETHHADYDVLVRVGGNMGQVEPNARGKRPRNAVRLTELLASVSRY